MDLQEILSVAIGTLIVVVLSHFAVFWVVRTLYPPQNQTVYMPQPSVVLPVAPAPVFTPPPVIEQHVTLPTYETSVPAQAPLPERTGPPAAESTSIRGESGLDAPNTQR